MAFTQEARFSFNIQDYLGVEGALQLYALLDPTKPISTLYGDLNALALIVDDLVSGKITSSTMSIYGSLGGLKGTPVSGEVFGQTGLFSFLPVAGLPHYGQAVPSLLSAVVSGGVINLSDSRVVSLLNWIEASNTDFQAADQHWRTLFGGALASAALSFRKRLKQQQLATFTPG